MGYPNGLVQDRLTEKFDKIAVFHKEEPLSAMFELVDQGLLTTMKQWMKAWTTR